MDGNTFCIGKMIIEKEIDQFFLSKNELFRWERDFDDERRLFEGKKMRVLKRNFSLVDIENH